MLKYQFQSHFKDYWLTFRKSPIPLNSVSPCGTMSRISNNEANQLTVDIMVEVIKLKTMMEEKLRVTTLQTEQESILDGIIKIDATHVQANLSS